MPLPPKLSPLASRLLVSGLNRDTVAALPEPAAPPPPAAAGSAKRIKLWELEDKYHCPVIGTCLDVEDLVRFARRFGFSASRRDAFALHTEAVGYSRSRNSVAEAFQRHLDRKYQPWLERFSRLKVDAEVRQLWQECLARGEVAGPLWAVLSHRAATAETRQAAYAEVHMLSHQVGAGQAADSRRLAYLEKENAELRQSLESQKRQAEAQSAAWRAQMAALESELAEQKRQNGELAALRAQLAGFESGRTLAEMGERLLGLQQANDHLRAAAQRVGELDQSLQRSRAEASQAWLERDQLAAERDALEQVLLAAGNDRDCSGQCQTCDQAHSPRCILYVGGRTALVHHYKALAERLGVRLIHHDGGLEESISRLPEMIHGVDAVVCPTDCISHTAYYQLKNHCKRSGKPCLFFKGAGVSSFAVAMARVTSGDFSLAGQSRAEAN